MINTVRNYPKTSPKSIKQNNKRKGKEEKKTPRQIKIQLALSATVSDEKNKINKSHTHTRIFIYISCN